MNEEWTIDTWVLYHAAEVEWDAIEFLNRITARKDRVVFDHEGKILDQYERCIRKSKQNRKGGCSTLEAWFVIIISKHAKKYSSSLHPRYIKDLNSLEFDDDDWPFVSVCAKSKNKRLVAEESDYNPIVKAYLKSSMSVNVLSVREAKDLAIES
jgi:hypothetical protein